MEKFRPKFTKTFVNVSDNNTAHAAVSSPLINAITLLIQQYGIGKVSNMVGVSKKLLRQIVNGDTVIQCKDSKFLELLNELVLMRKELINQALEKDKQIAGLSEILIKHLV